MLENRTVYKKEPNEILGLKNILTENNSMDEAIPTRKTTAEETSKDKSERRFRNKT